MSYEQQVNKKSNINPDTSIHKSLHSRPFNTQNVNNSSAPPTQQDTENQQYQQDNFDATKLGLQAKYGVITPEGRERLTSLQMKKADFWQRYLAPTRRFSQGFGNIPFSRTGVQSQQAIQTKLTIGAVGDKYEQEADRVAEEVVNQINTPVSGQPNQNVQREEMPFEDELRMKPEISNIQRSTMPSEEKKNHSIPQLQLQVGNDSGVIQAAFWDRLRKPWNREPKNIKPEDIASVKWANYFMSPKGNQRKTDAYNKFKHDYGLNLRNHTTDEIFNALIQKSSRGYYLVGGTTPWKISMATGVWNCESLAMALIEIANDIGTEKGGVLESTNIRKLSSPGVIPAMNCFRQGNVVEENGQRRTSFSTHTWAVINGTPYDPLMGVSGARVASIWEHDVNDNQVTISGVNYRYEQLDKKEGPIKKAKLIQMKGDKNP